MYLVEIILLSFIFPLITVLWFIRNKRIKLQGKEILVLKEESCKENIKIIDSFDVSVKNKWYRIKISFKRRVSSAEEYKKQFNSEHHGYKLLILNSSEEEIYSEERSITDFFGFCWYPPGKKKKSLDSVCDAVILEFIPPEPGTYSVNFQLKAKEEGSKIKDIVLRVTEGVRPATKEPCIHNCSDLKKKKIEEKPEQEADKKKE